MEQPIENQQEIKETNTEGSQKRTYSEEEVEKIIEDLKRKAESETDRRVNQALNTREEKYKSDKMTMEEQIEGLQSQVAQLIKENTIAQSRNLAMQELGVAGINVSSNSEFLDMCIGNTQEETLNRVRILASTVDKIKQETTDKIKQEYSNIPAPTTSNAQTTMTVEQFDKMTLAEQLEFCKQNPLVANKILGV